MNFSTFRLVIMFTICALPHHKLQPWRDRNVLWSAFSIFYAILLLSGITVAVAAELPARSPSDFVKSSDITKPAETAESAAVLFVSTNKNPSELDRQVTDLYLTLFNTGRLSVRKVAIQ